jgi:hypothetical protein
MQVSPCTHPAFESGVIPVVRRHAEDAAFYWKQIDTSLSEPGLGARRAQHFAELLASHLEGLAVAGKAALAPSLEAFERWRKPGEAFVAFYCALRLEDDAFISCVLQGVARTPSLLLRGIVSALAHTPDLVARPWIDRQLDRPALETPMSLVATVAALRACALRGWEVPQEDKWLTHESPFVRASACRAAPPDAAEALMTRLSDEDMAVRAEAAIRLARIHPVQAESPAPERLQAASVLWQCVAEQAQRSTQATGLERLLSHRRLLRWLRHLAWLAPVGHADVATLLQHLPMRAALSFVLFHADLRLLPFVVQAMGDTEHARWAGWVWQGLTGADLRNEGLVLPEPERAVGGEPLTRAGQDADQGLALPNAAAVVAHPASGSAQAVSDGTRVLMGRSITPQTLAVLLSLDTNLPQALRGVAAQAWNAGRHGSPISLRANAATLIHQEAALQSA